MAAAAAAAAAHARCERPVLLRAPREIASDIKQHGYPDGAAAAAVAAGSATCISGTIEVAMRGETEGEHERLQRCRRNRGQEL